MTNLVNNLTNLIPVIQLPPADIYELPADFIDCIFTILDNPSPPPSLPPFIFEITSEAASDNANLLKRFIYDMTRAIITHPNRHISYGSEFRSASVRAPLLHLSPFWDEINLSLSKGAKYPLERINNAKRRTDLE